MVMLDGRRRDFLLRSLLTKLVARGAKPTLRICLERAFRKFDRNESGELDYDEFRLAMEENLPGISEDEIQALARDFDVDGDGVVSITEFIQRLSVLEADSCVAIGSHSSHAGFCGGSERRPNAGGIALRRPEEFVDDGYNKATADDFDGFFGELRAKLEAMAARFQVQGSEGTLLKRALDRYKSTPKAKHVTIDQFAQALSHFLDDRDARLEERVWKNCGSGDVDAVVRFYHRCRESAKNAPAAPVVPRGNIRTARLKHLLLDKIHALKGHGSFRVRVKRVLDKYDGDKSGELDRAECQRAFSDLLPGVEANDVGCLLDELDVDGSGAASIDEVVLALVETHRSRAPLETSIKLPRKQPLWTKAGSRGL